MTPREYQTFREPGRKGPGERRHSIWETIVETFLDPEPVSSKGQAGWSRVQFRVWSICSLLLQVIGYYRLVQAARNDLRPRKGLAGGSLGAPVQAERSCHPVLGLQAAGPSGQGQLLPLRFSIPVCLPMSCFSPEGGTASSSPYLAPAHARCQSSSAWAVGGPGWGHNRTPLPEGESGGGPAVSWNPSEAKPSPGSW